MLGVLAFCDDKIQNGHCTGTLHEIDNLSAMSDLSLNPELVATVFGGGLLLWITGLGIGLVVNQIRKMR